MDKTEALHPAMMARSFEHVLVTNGIKLLSLSGALEEAFNYDGVYERNIQFRARNKMKLVLL